MNFVVAFLAEARPIIEHYGLEKEPDMDLPVYKKDQRFLIVSGMGRKRTAQAISFLHKIRNGRSTPWLNLGIAGHGEYDLGEVFLAGKIMDDKSDEVFFPPQIFGQICRVSQLTTCSKPSTAYSKGMGLDMEAHAFYKLASSYSTRELVQVLKVVSDNSSCKELNVSPSKATDLIAGSIPVVLNLVEQMEQISKELQPPEEFEIMHQQLVSIHHFSTTRAHQLYNLMRHANVLGKDMNELKSLVHSAKNSSEAISQAEKWLDDSRRMR